MFANAKLVLCAAIMLLAASAASAKVAVIPGIDLQKNCRVSERTILSLFSDVKIDVYEACMQQEQDARAQLAKGWATFPAADKAQCVQAGQYMPSYVEWLTCFEMTRDVRQMRKDEQSTGSAGSNMQSPSRRNGARECPIIQMRNDGSVASVIAC